MSQIYAIGGGKGGSGKSFIAANLGVLLAKKNLKVVLVDLDLGCANLHTLLGIKNTSTGADQFFNKTFSHLYDVAVPTSISNLSIITTMNCPMEIANLFHAQKLRLINAIKKLPHDLILLDLGAGTSYNTLDFFLTANRGLFIFTPEPTSIENTFRFIKAVYLRKLKQILKQDPFLGLIREMVDKGENRTITSPAQIIGILTRKDPCTGQLLGKKLQELPFKLVLNQFRKQTDNVLGEKIAKLCNRYFYSSFQFLGNVGYDERVHDAISSRKIYIVTHPYTLTAMDLQRIAEKMVTDHNNALLYQQKTS